MAVKIRLARAGAKKAPFYRVVAADSRSPRDGRYIEILGRYNPRTEPSTIEMDLTKVDAWLSKGAQPSETVAKLIEIARNPATEAPAAAKRPSKKAQAKAAVKEAPEAPAAAPAEPAPAAEAPAEQPAEEPTAEEPAPEEPVAEESPAETSAEDE